MSRGLGDVYKRQDKKEFDSHMDRVRKLARSLNPNKKKKISWWA